MRSTAPLSIRLGGRPPNAGVRARTSTAATIIDRAAAVPGQSGASLREDPVAERVARPRERERRVRVQALEAAVRAASRRPDGAAPAGARAALRARARGSTELRLLAAARDQRSTPPAASSRETCVARCEHVSQNCVGKGVPSQSNGACSVTAGPPNGHLTATRRNARGAGRAAARRPRDRPSAEVRRRPGCRHRLSACATQRCPRTMNSCSPGLTSPSLRASRTSASPVPTVASRFSSCSAALEAAGPRPRAGRATPRCARSCAAASSRGARPAQPAEREQPCRRALGPLSPRRSRSSCSPVRRRRP